MIFRLQRISHQSAVGANRIGQPDSLWNVPLLPTGLCLRFSSAKNIIHITAGQNFVVQSWIELQSEDFVFKKQMFPQAYKKIICPLNNQVCHYPDHDCTRSKLLVRNCALLGYYAASIGNSLPTFRDNPSASSSWILDP